MNDTIIYHLPYGLSYFNIKFQKVLAKIFKKKKKMKTEIALKSYVLDLFIFF